MSTWFRVHHVDGKAQVFLGDEIGFGPDVDDLLVQIESATEIELTINSAGGCGFATAKIYQALLGRTPRATVTGTAASAAAFVMLAAGRIHISRSGSVMLHPPSGWAFASARKLREHADFLDRFTGEWVDVLSKRTSADVDTVRGWLCGDRDHWFNAEESVQLGLCDSIYDPPAIQSADAAADNEAKPAVLHEGKAELLFDLLRALGPIEARDKDRLFRNLSAWFGQNISEVKE